MIERLLEPLATHGLGDWAEQLRDDLPERLTAHGDFPRWAEALETLPVTEGEPLLDRSSVGIAGTVDDATRDRIEQALQELHPWRKGPFQIHGLEIDTEWRSDWKWDRIEPHLEDPRGRRILDIGCGNGYHCWRWLGAGARLAVGIDPTLVFVLQFLALQHFLKDPRASVLPLGIEDLPEALTGFDTVLSMGVLYHRRSPIDHLQTLFRLLRPGGQLVLETLIIEGDAQNVLVPEGRYARMRNVWFLPSTTHLEGWMQRCGFQQVRTVDQTVTTVEEQRTTDWMRFQSLVECLDPDDPTRTVEGYPAPRRAVLIARRPGP